MWIDPTPIVNRAATQEQLVSPRPCVCGGFRGTLQAWEPGQQWSAVLCRSSPWAFTGGSDCLDWWFRMFTGSEGTIIHRGRGQLWIAFLPALLSLLLTPATPPTLYPESHHTHQRHGAPLTILIIWYVSTNEHFHHWMYAVCPERLKHWCLGNWPYIISFQFLCKSDLFDGFTIWDAQYSVWIETQIKLNATDSRVRNKIAVPWHFWESSIV